MAEQAPAAVAPGSPQAVADLLGGQAYLCDRGLATAVYLALTLDQPLLVEGEAGVGKTEVAKAVAAALGRSLVRLQCYEGIDAGEALYEWDYPRQLLHLRAVSDTSGGGERAVDDLFGPRFLLERPLLTALRRGDRAVLLIDEVDRADDEFEAFLLEILSDFQITIPEIGTIVTDRPPVVVLTSNRTRELHDALKRRCLYHWIDYPDPEREAEIVRLRAPGLPDPLVRAVVGVVSRLREADLTKAPGVAETINWARALALLGVERLEAEAVAPTLGAVLKDRDDLARVQAGLKLLLDDAGG
ncbi:MAG TPA: MoxR family ATPase [Actinomycetes bacterium]|nr:MoxR family ATPase [Actinomycetes bacterium]